MRYAIRMAESQAGRRVWPRETWNVMLKETDSELDVVRYAKKRTSTYEGAWTDQIR